MIHLLSEKTNKAFCGNERNGDVCTNETPPHYREVKNLCKGCVKLREEYMDNQARL